MRAMKDSGIEWIGEIPQEWDLRKIKTNFDIVAGATPKSGEASYWDGDIPWITPADYTTEDVYVSIGHKNITREGMNSCATSLVPEGSIVFSKRAPIGLVAISSNPLCTNQGCLSCIPKESVDVKYYYYVMSIYSEQFDLFASGTTFKEISAVSFANFKLPFPNFETQSRIASYLDAKCSEIDSLIAANEKTNELLKEQRQSLIYEAVTGKIEAIGIRNSYPK
jgi:type I restriction enzyme S subunit